MVEHYIKVYYWLLRHPDLSQLEALLISEIMFWPNGCHKSSARLAREFKSNPRTIQRAVTSLVRRKWLAILYETKQKRILWATTKEPPIGELFEYRETAIKSIIKTTADKLSVNKKTGRDSSGKKGR